MAQELEKFNTFDGEPLPKRGGGFHPELACHVVVTPPEITVERYQPTNGEERDEKQYWSGFYVTANRFDGSSLTGNEAVAARKIILRGMSERRVVDRFFVGGRGRSAWRGGRGRSYLDPATGLQTINAQGRPVAKTAKWAALAYVHKTSVKTSVAIYRDDRWLLTAGAVEHGMEAMFRMMKTSAWGAVVLSFEGEEQWWHDDGWTYKLAEKHLCGASPQHVVGYASERPHQPELYENDAIVGIGVPRDDEERTYPSTGPGEVRMDEGRERYTRYFLKCVPNEDVDRMASSLQALLSGAFGFPLPDLQD